MLDISPDKQIDQYAESVTSFCTNCEEDFSWVPSNPDLHVIVCPRCSKIQGAVGKQELVEEWKEQGGPRNTPYEPVDQIELERKDSL